MKSTFVHTLSAIVFSALAFLGAPSFGQEAFSSEERKGAVQQALNDATTALGATIDARDREDAPDIVGNEGDKADKAMSAIQFMNYLRFVSYEIDSYRNIFVIEDEYRNLSPDNLNLNMIPDSDILEAIKHHLDLLYDVRAEDRIRQHFEKELVKQKRRARQDLAVNLVKARIASGVEGAELAVHVASGFLPGKEIDVKATKQLAMAMANEAIGPVTSYMDAQRSIQDANDDFQYTYDTQKGKRLHEENLKNFDFTLKMIRRYGIEDELRLTEDMAKALVECVKSSDVEGVFARLKVMATHQPAYRHFPMFWSHYAAFAVRSGHYGEALEASRNFNEINRASLFRSSRMDAETAMAEVQAIVALGKDDPEAIRRALGVVARYNFDSHDYDMAFFCASVFYSVLGDSQSALDILNGLIAVQMSELRGELIEYRDLFKRAKDVSDYKAPPMASDIARCMALREAIKGGDSDAAFRASLDTAFGASVISGLERLYSIGSVRNVDLFKKAKPEIESIGLSFVESTWKGDRLLARVPACWFVLGDFTVTADLLHGTNVTATLTDEFKGRRIVFPQPVSEKGFVEIPFACSAKQLKGVDSVVLHIPNVSWPVALTFLPPQGTVIAKAEYPDTALFVLDSVDFIGQPYPMAKYDAVVPFAMRPDGADKTEYKFPFPDHGVNFPDAELTAISVAEGGYGLDATWTNRTASVCQLEVSAQFLSENGAVLAETEAVREVPANASGTLAIAGPDATGRKPAAIHLSVLQKKTLAQQGRDLSDKTKAFGGKISGKGKALAGKAGKWFKRDGKDAESVEDGDSDSAEK